MPAVINCHQSVWHSFLQPIRVIHDVGRQVLNLDTATNRARSLNRDSMARGLKLFGVKIFNQQTFFLFCFGNCQDSNSDFNVMNDVSNASDSVVVSMLNF